MGSQFDNHCLTWELPRTAVQKNNDLIKKKKKKEPQLQFITSILALFENYGHDLSFLNKPLKTFCNCYLHDDANHTGKEQQLPRLLQEECD